MSVGEDGEDAAPIGCPPQNSSVFTHIHMARFLYLATIFVSQAAGDLAAVGVDGPGDPKPPFPVEPFTTDHGAACGVRLGMIVLSVDETIEHEYRRYFPYDATSTLYVSRQYKGPEIDVASLNHTRAEITNSSKLLNFGQTYDAVGFACTSDAAVLTPQTVASLVSVGADVAAAAVTNPLTAAIRAFKALEAKKVGVLLPYSEEVSALVVDKFVEYAIPVASVAIFDETADEAVSRIDADSVVAAVEKLAAAGADAVFVSCTNTRTLDVIARAEKATGVPVVSSNSAMAWDMMRLAGMLTDDVRKDRATFGGKLFDVAVENQGPRHQCP